jgi:lipoprotein-releasing system permease protein
MGQVMLSTEANVDGAIIKGVDPATAGEVTDLPRDVLPGGASSKSRRWES